LFIPFFWAAAAPSMGLLLHHGCTLLRNLAPDWAWLSQAVASLIICPGDPILYFINKQWPEIFYFREFRIINLQPVMFVTCPDSVHEKLGSN
jgi:hypothetical protein